MDAKIALKEQVFEACRRTIQQKMDRLLNAVRDAQAAANEETKSSAGDKYETGRSMAQLEIEKFSAQLASLNKQMQELTRVGIDHDSKLVRAGSLVHTNMGAFFIAVNAGEVIIDNKKFFAISTQAPIAVKMLGLSVNDSFLLNGRMFVLHDVA